MNRTPESPVAIVGSRKYPNLEQVRAFVRSLPLDACLISGGAKGVDQAAESEAVKRGLEIISYRPESGETGYVIVRHHFIEGEWTKPKVLRGFFRFFAAAAHARNSLIVNDAVAYGGSLVAFWDGESTGTKSTIDKAEAAGILFEVFTP